MVQNYFTESPQRDLTRVRARCIFVQRARVTWHTASH